MNIHVHVWAYRGLSYHWQRTQLPLYTNMISTRTQSIHFHQCTCWVWLSYIVYTIYHSAVFYHIPAFLYAPVHVHICLHYAIIMNMLKLMCVKCSEVCVPFWKLITIQFVVTRHVYKEMCRVLCESTCYRKLWNVSIAECQERFSPASSNSTTAAVPCWPAYLALERPKSWCWH